MKKYELEIDTTLLSCTVKELKEELDKDERIQELLKTGSLFGEYCSPRPIANLDNNGRREFLNRFLFIDLPKISHKILSYKLIDNKLYAVVRSIHDYYIDESNTVLIPRALKSKDNDKIRIITFDLSIRK